MVKMTADIIFLPVKPLKWAVTGRRTAVTLSADSLLTDKRKCCFVTRTKSLLAISLPFL